MKLERSAVVRLGSLEAMAGRWNFILNAVGNHWSVFKGVGVRDR